MKKTIFFITTSLIILLSSCLKTEEYRTLDDELTELEAYIDTNNITVSPTWTGLYYMIVDTGTGIRPEYYDTVEIEYTATRIDGSLLGSSEDDGDAYSFSLYNNSIISGLSEAVSYMNEGGKATAIMPSYLAYGGYQYNEIEPYTTLIYQIELIKVHHSIEIEPVSTDTLTLNSTSSGLEYYILKADSGDNVYAGNYVKVHYTGYLSNGRIFDSSVKRNKAVTFQVGYGNLINGWEEGLLLMRKGEKFRFIIPADLAYGEYGNYPVIPPDETLIFDIELLDVY